MKLLETHNFTDKQKRLKYPKSSTINHEYNNCFRSADYKRSKR